MQQRVPGRQRCLGAAAQIHQAGAPELVPQLVRGPDGQRGAAHARRAVQHHDRGAGLGRGARGLHPLGDPAELRAPPRERPLRLGQMAERLLQDRTAPGRRALVRAAQLGGHGGAGLLAGTGRRGGHALLVQERADAPYVQGRQPLKPQLLGAARPAELARAPVCGGPVRRGHPDDGGRGPGDGHGRPGADRGPRAGPERRVRDDGGDRRDPGHQERRARLLTREPGPQRGLPGRRLVQRPGVRRVLLLGARRQRVQRRPAACQQRVGVGPAAGAPHLLLHRAHQQPLGLRPMAVPHVRPPPRASAAT